MSSPQIYLTREQVRAFDRRAIDEFGIPSPVLMENAGRGCVDVLTSLGARGPVVVCCGKGNNGGDGLVIARHLANRGVTLEILLFAKPEDLSADAAAQWRIVRQMHLPARVLADESFADAELAAELARADWVVDALFGTGLSGALRPPFDRVVRLINACPGRILAVDIPSGLDANTGEPLGACVRARHTVTFVAPKLGYRNPAAAPYLGQVHVADIGITPRFLPVE
jgi:NAD(P)H-hydrate epimerase